MVCLRRRRRGGLPDLGPLVAALWLSLHLASIGGGRPAGRSPELKLLIAAMLVGYALDSALVLGGGIAFPEHAGPAGPTTPWMVALWAGSRRPCATASTGRGADTC